MRDKDPEIRNTMLAHISTWQSSEVTQKAYCLEHNIRYFVFHYWLKVYRNLHPIKKQQSSSFVKLKVKPPGSASHAELILPDGRRIVFHQAVTSDFLKSLIS